MDVIKLCGFALAAAIFAFALKAADRQLSLCLSLAAGAILLLTALSYVGRVVTALSAIADRAGMEGETLSLLFRLMGMAYVTEFGVQACKDAEEEGIAMKLQFCGKAAMAVMTLPIIQRLSELVFSLVP